jgi:hypothetical protein
LSTPTLTPTVLPETPNPQIDTEHDEELDPGQHAHIVKTEPGKSAAAVVLEARIFGTPVEALCGHRWVPSKDPQKLPICPKCKEVYEMFRIFNEDLGDTPGA